MPDAPEQVLPSLRSTPELLRNGEVVQGLCERFSAPRPVSRQAKSQTMKLSDLLKQSGREMPACSESKEHRKIVTDNRSGASLVSRMFASQKR